jgi:gluconolactonase
MGQEAEFRSYFKDGGFNPSNTTPPFFQIFDMDFLKILGRNPSIHEIASNETFEFAHEAPVYFPDSDELFFSSVCGGPLGLSDWNTNNQVFKISMTAVEAALAANVHSNRTANVPVTEVDYYSF